MKKLLIFQEMKLFNLKLKNSCFLGESFRVFHHCFFGCFHFFMFFLLDVFISSCFHFFRRFWVFSLLVAFVHFTVSSLFLYCCCYCECYGFEKAFFTLRCFFNLTLLSCFYQGFPGASSSALKVAGWNWGSKHRPDPSVCLNHTVFGSYMINRELYLNSPKYGDKLIVAKSLINFKHIS